MADNDAMDFSFDSVSKGKKKTFNFEKLDMDFNLDGEFDISSFKVDMSDLDFSCSPKKPPKSKENKGGDMSDLDFSCSPKKLAKPKENKGGESSGAKEKKQNGFDFSFDFNEMDSFNLDSSLMKGDTTSTSNLNKKGVTSDRSDSEVAKEPKPKDDELAHASNDSMAMKPSASEMVETSKAEIMVGSQRDLGSTQDGSVSKVSSSGKLDMLIETTSGINTASTEEIDQERELPEKKKPSELKSQDINNQPSKCVGQNDSNQDTSLDRHAEVYSPGAEVITGSGCKQNVINKATYVSSDGVKLLLENSFSHQIIKSESSNGAVKFGSSTQAEATNEPEPVNSDASFENNTKAVLVKQISHDNVENQNSTLEGHLGTASSKHVDDKVLLMQNKEIKGIQSNFFSKREDNSIPSKHNMLTGGRGASFGCKRLWNLKSNDSECGTKSIHDSTPATSEPVREELVLLVDNGDVKISSKAREGIVSDGIPSGGKLAGNMRPIHIEEKKSKTMALETDMSSKDVKLQSSQVNSSCLTEKTARHATQIPVHLQARSSDKESFKNSRENREGNILSSVKAAKITPALSGFKTSKTGGTNKVLTTSIRQKETNSSGNSVQTEIQGITALKSDYHIDNAENQKPTTFSLKRKTMEVSEADLVPLRSLKRLSQSPSKSSSSNECPGKVVEKVESMPNSLHCNSPAPGLQRLSEINLMEVKLHASVLVKDNGNVEKAEAYTKELEDICNMLKKKHEEAKELVVRAVVNNNNLLMLNHPIYEEKIRKVQKLTLQLMSKGIQT